MDTTNDLVSTNSSNIRRLEFIPPVVPIPIFNLYAIKASF
jgi:hypothetical protein